MLIWSGKGVWSLVVLVLSALMGSWMFSDQYFDYILIVSLLFSAAFSWFMGIYWNKVNPKLVFDEDTNEKYYVKSSLFFITMQYWGIIFYAIALLGLYEKSILAFSIALVVFSALIVFYLLKRKKSKDEDAVYADEALEKIENELNALDSELSSSVASSEEDEDVAS